MTLIFQNDFTSNFSNVRQIQAINTSPSGAADPDGIPDRVEIKNRVYRSHIVDTDPETFGGIRSELVFDYGAIGDDRWYVFDVMVAAHEWGEITNFSIFQVHNESPTNAVPLIGIIKYGALRIYEPLVEPPTDGTEGKISASVEYPFNVWNTISIHAKWKSDTTGLMEVWMNKTPILRTWNKGTSYVGDTPYLKLGIYNTQDTPGFGTRTAYYRNLRVYNAPEPYATVLRSLSLE